MSDDLEAEVTEKSPGRKRHVVNLEEKTCTCREWQVFGKPCVHALAFITSVRVLHIESFVDECYSVAKFIAAYAPCIPSLTNMSQWPKSTHGFFLYPPILKRSAGRLRNTRCKGGSEWRDIGKRSGSQKYPICKNFGHRWKTCKEAGPDAKEAFALLANQRYVSICDFSYHCIVLYCDEFTTCKRKRKNKAPSTSSSCAVTSSTLDFLGPQSSSGPNHLQSQCAIVPVTEASTPPPKARGKGKQTNQT